METIKWMSISLLVALMIGFVINPAGQFGPSVDVRTSNESGLGNTSGVDEKFEGGVKAYIIGRGGKVEVRSPEGPGGN
jgi:hypothetical protein